MDNIPDENPDFPESAIAALRKGNKIEAIKIVRLQWKLDLKDAKDRVEEYVESQPELKKAMKEAQAGARSRFIEFLIAMAALALALYYLLAGK
ncbi:MAG: hypothetical protein V1794_00440 [Candidatus Glassbacteria bacterium]